MLMDMDGIGVAKDGVPGSFDFRYLWVLARGETFPSFLDFKVLGSYSHKDVLCSMVYGHLMRRRIALSGLCYLEVRRIPTTFPLYSPPFPTKCFFFSLFLAYFPTSMN